MLKNSYLLLLIFWHVATSHCYIAQIDCSDMMGTKKTEQTWTCSADGSAECGEVVRDCLPCDEDGNEYGGTANYPANGPSYATGGWDCRSKCSYGQGSSGSKTKTKWNSC